MNRFLAYAFYLLFAAGAAWVINWAVPHNEWHLLPQMWGSIAIVVLAVLAVPLSGVLLHELAHGAAALVTGYRIHSICFWAPLALTHFKLMGVWFACGNHLRGAGYCIAYPKRPRTRRPLLYPAAGPLMNLALALGGAWSAECTQGWTSRWLAGIALVNALYFGSSIMPRRVWISGRQALSDGARILSSMTAPVGKDLVELKLEYAWGLALKGRVAEAEGIVSGCLSECPGHSGAKGFQAWLHWRDGKKKESLELFESVAAEPDAGADVQASLALILCEEGPLRNLERADALSKKALADSPRSAHAVMVRGVVLGSLNRSDEARQYFDRAYETLLDPDERGYVAAVRGLYMAAEDHPAGAKRLLRQAIHLGGRRGTVWALARAIRRAGKATRKSLVDDGSPRGVASP